MTIRSYRDLRVWRAAMDLVEQVYRLTGTFPRHELYGLGGQMQRAAVSIPSNIAEGHSRAHLKEYLHHISMAQASVAELETQLEIALRLNYCTPEQARLVFDQAASVGRQLHALRDGLLRGPRPQHPAPSTQHP